MESLTASERDGSVWRKVRGVIAQKLASSRESLEMPNDADHSNRLRGEINAYKELLRLEEPPRDIPQDILT